MLWSLWQQSGRGTDKVRNMKECGMTGHPVVVARHLCRDVRFRLDYEGFSLKGLDWITCYAV